MLHIRECGSVLGRQKCDAAFSTASATCATQHAPRVLAPLVPPVLWRATPSVSVTERDVLGMKIPVEGSPGVEARSQSLCNLCYTPPTPQRGPNTPSHAGLWSECPPGGRRHDHGRLLPYYPWDRFTCFGLIKPPIFKTDACPIYLSNCPKNQPV